MTLSSEELLALNRELDQLERFKKENPLLFFRPNGPQSRIFGSDATYRCLFGANKVGKSTGGVIEDISYCLGYRPFLPKDHPRYKTPFEPPVKGMCFAETWDKTDEVLTVHFEKWIPKGVAEPIRRQGRVVGWQFANGSEIRYSTYQMDPDRMEGADKHFYHFDEPPPFALWAPVTRGIVVHGGKIWLTLTLLSEGWIWDEIWERHEAGDPDYYATTGDIRDNVRRVNDDGTVTGALSEEAIARFEKTLDDVSREVRLHGKPQHLQGRIFKQFKVREPWVIEEWDIDPTWPTIRAFDPHLSKPVAVLWAKVTPSGRLIVTDELFDSSIQDIDQLASRVKEIEKKRRHNVRLSVMDSSAGMKDLNGKSMIDIFAEHGMRCVPAPKADKRARVYETAERFKLDSIARQPRIVIFRNCDRLVWEIKRYVHPELRKKTNTERYKDIPEGQDKRDDDLIDCLLYMVSQDPTYEKLTSGFNFYREDLGAVRDEGRRVIFAEEYSRSYAWDGRANGTEDFPY